MSENDILKTSEEIKKGKYKLLSKEKFSEKILLKIAEILQEDENFDVATIINIILHNRVNENCDWNIGSILQHFDYNLIVKVLSEIKITQRGYLYDSIGFCWVLGEFPYKMNE